jgi:hypothetical protein
MLARWSLVMCSQIPAWMCCDSLDLLHCFLVQLMHQVDLMMTCCGWVRIWRLEMHKNGDLEGVDAEFFGVGEWTSWVMDD